MYFQQFFLSCLAHASYFIGSEGVAAVVDPQRDVDIYLREAEEHGFTIRYVIETHLHADFVSGHRELAARTGAQIYLGARAHAAFRMSTCAKATSCSSASAGLHFSRRRDTRLKASASSFTTRTAKPAMVLTGDTLFIGDVGRPDLGGDPKDLAAMLYDSLHGKLMKLPDEVAVFPAHGAGSLCGRAMSSDRSSTIGRERQTNYALQAPDKASFVELLTSELPDRPDYFATDVELNRKGATPLDQLQAPQALSPQELRARQEAGAIVLDTRDEDAYGAGHVPGSISISLDGQFAVWAGTIVGLENDVIIVAEDEERVRESQMRLTRVGIDRANAYLAGGIEAWKAANMPVAQVTLLDPSEFASAIEQPNVQVVDVRRPVEWSSGHLSSAVHMPLNHLMGTMRELDPKRPIAVHCKSGYRSSIAVSLLQREGFSDIVHMRGGWDAWQETGR